MRWPESFDRALETRGFAREVQTVLSRAREKSMDGAALAALGREHDLPAYVAAGLFLERYLDILDDQSATDYADLIRRAVIEAHVHRDDLRRQFRHVFVDEYQDTDPGQVDLLRALAGDGGDLVAVGDPHQSIYGFRGAEVRGILEFPTDFPRADGTPAEVVSLRTTRRFGPRLLVATQRVAGRIGLPGTLDPVAREAFLHPVADPGGSGRERDDGLVSVRTFDTERAEAEHLADLLRRAHLEDGIPWDRMAVLVRSGRASIPPLRRALGGAGVPVEVARDELPLVRDPAVLPLLDALRAVVNLDNDDEDPADYVDHGPRRVAAARAARRARRRRRTPPRPAAARPREGRRPRRGPARRRPRTELLRLAVLDDGFLDEAGRHRGRRSPGACTGWLLRDGRRARRRRAPPRRSCGRCGPAPTGPAACAGRSTLGGGGARRAHRDLDSVVALFDVAARGPRSATSPRSPAPTGSATSSPAWSPSRSRPTRSPSRACAAPPYGC